jgi:hypothetical protein
MKRFTREWHTGQLSDEEYDGRLTEYQMHRDALAGVAPEGVCQLLKTSLDDAQLQEGYQFVSLTYRGAELIGATVDDLRRWSSTRRGSFSPMRSNFLVTADTSIGSCSIRSVSSRFGSIRWR